MTHFKKYSLTLENMFWLIEYTTTKHSRNIVNLKHQLKLNSENIKMLSAMHYSRPVILASNYCIY